VVSRRQLVDAGFAARSIAHRVETGLTGQKEREAARFRALLA
jgi:hypothetical protein